MGSMAVRVRPQVINLLADGGEPSYSFDRAGRLIGAYVDGQNYRRSLDNRVLLKWRGAEGGRQRRWLTGPESEAFLLSAYAVARSAVADLEDDRLRVLERWDWPALQADAGAFRSIYKPISILPPDQYLSLVLQATEGCSYNGCTFCDFYRDRPFRIKNEGEFRSHIAAVQAFLGPSLALRKSLFLADANALVAPMRRVHGWLDVIEQSEILPGAGIFSFVDAFHTHRKSLADWQELAGRGLRRVYIGLETGDDELLRFLRKQATAADALQAVQLLHAAGIAVCVIVMLGIGGDRFAAAHVANTAQVLRSMALGSGDLVYFSPFVDSSGSDYGRLAQAAGISPLTEEEMEAQAQHLRRCVIQASPDRGPQFSRYDIREFVY